MAKLRHIAIIVEDPEASAKFFEEAFDMKRAGTARRGIYMSDGIFNVALLKKENEKEKVGLYHFGMWVDDLDEAEKKVVAAGGEYLAGRPTSPQVIWKQPSPKRHTTGRSGRASLAAIAPGRPKPMDDQPLVMWKVFGAYAVHWLAI